MNDPRECPEHLDYDGRTAPPIDCHHCWIIWLHYERVAIEPASPALVPHEPKGAKPKERVPQCRLCGRENVYAAASDRTKCQDCEAVARRADFKACNITAIRKDMIHSGVPIRGINGSDL